MAYEASFRRDLLDGFDVFMDDSIVLPMGQHYDQDTLLPILHKFMKREREVEAEYDPVSAARRGQSAQFGTSSCCGPVALSTRRETNHLEHQSSERPLVCRPVE